MTDYILNGVLGLAVGDALGQPAQGKTRESLKFSPVLEMRQGLWSDCLLYTSPSPRDA